MSRTVAAQEADDDSFAGLLERLTQRQKRDHPDTNAVAGTRPLVPIREMKSMRSTTAADTVELSYERALQRHARHRPIDVPAIPLPDLPASIGSTQKPRSKVRAHNSEPPPKGQSTQPAKAMPSKAQPETPRPIPERHNASPPIEHRSHSAPQTAGKAVTRSRKKGGRRLAAPAPNEQPQKTRINPPPGAVDPVIPAHLAHLQNKRIKTSKPAPVIAPTGPTISALKRESLDNPALAFRRSIISVRLSEEEFSRLRDRASESGITVSAYMRSCVLEAEHLRSQVKQALAEMRASTRPAEPAHTPAWTRSVQSTLEHGGVWSRFAARSATFFLGLWFPFRREGRLQVQHEKSLLR